MMLIGNQTPTETRHMRYVRLTGSVGVAAVLAVWLVPVVAQTPDLWD